MASPAPPPSSAEGKEEPAAGSQWHKHDWDRILGGEGVADRYFARGGIIRKDRLALFAPPGRHPPTAQPVRSAADLLEGLRELGATPAASSGPGGDDASVRFVLKKAHSSNAHGIRFLTGDDTRALLKDASCNARVGDGRRFGSRGLALSLVTSSALATVLMLRLRGSAAWLQKSGPRSLGVLVLPAALSLATLAALCGGASRGRGPRGSGAADLAADCACGKADTGSKMEDSVPIVAELEQLLNGTPDMWLLQRHVDPWLLRGRKFHLRVLFLCVGDLEAYVHEDVRILLATEPFASGCRDSTRHSALVTNMGVNRQHTDYEEEVQNLSLMAELGRQEAEEILAEVADVLGETIQRIRAAGRRHLFALPNCWELFGADFLREGGSGRMLLLEVNPSPSLAMYGEGPDVRARLLGARSPLEGLPAGAGWRPVRVGAEEG